MRLNGKVVVVTGACGGIGRAIVDRFVEEGAHVLAVDLDESQTRQFTTSHGAWVRGHVGDVCDYAQVERMLDAAIGHFGTLDIVLNNAGVAAAKPLLDHDPATDFERIARINQNGVYHGILAAGRRLRALGKSGVILNTSSVYATMAAELTFAYNVSKAAVDMMTRCAALELAPHRIRVCAVAPGRVDTPMLRQYEALGLWNHIRREQMRATMTQPQEIAAVFAFLASDDANCINGTTVHSDDGFASFKYPLLPESVSA